MSFILFVAFIGLAARIGFVICVIRFDGFIARIDFMA
jgi:hypothetical protein